MDQQPTQIQQHQSQQPPSAGPTDSPHQDEGSRGRRRTRDNEDNDEDDGQDDDGTGNGSSKKRRRSRKGLDKKFECPHDGCGKSYSRAEHLYRHQLNHNPKQIYHCDFPDCQRSFVRQDLCARHKERHTAKGSQLLRKENFIQNLNPIVTAAMQTQGARLKQGPQPPNTFQPPQHHDQRHSPSTPMTGHAAVRSEDNTPLDPSLQSQPMDITMHQRSQRDMHYTGSEVDVKPQISQYPTPTQSNFQGSAPSYRGAHQRQSMDANGNAISTSAHHSQSQHFSGHPSQSPSPFHQHQNFPPLTQLPPPGYATMTPQASAGAQGHHNVTSAPDGMTTHANAPADGTAFSMDGTTPTYAMPMFGGDGYSRSPFAMADDFTAWLFNDPGFGGGQGAQMPGYANNNGMYPGSNMNSSSNFTLQAPYFSHDPMVNGQFATPAPPSHPMAVASLLDSNTQQVAMSEERRQQILDLIDTKFVDESYEPVVQTKKEIMEGNRDDDRHILSLHMMQTYIGSYWYHFHPQMPILHKPTFSANNCPELLLVAVMALGASCLEKTHGYEVTQNCAELAGFLAWHLRWAIFMNADFRPPAKLWVFQALLLLEVFEKMYSTRPLHERAHIHHATTLTLMRRGSSLIGRSSIDSPPNGSAANTRSGSINGTLTGVSTNQFTPDEWWNQWITNEATRRAAFAAFVMDSIHATMFGHSAVMVAHEMRLPLPCDEALWSATSSAEVGRVEQSLHQNGIKPVTFLEGLKRTLNNSSVRTNSFGRTILMAGLLSVSWHMNQRDLQVSSLGAAQALGGRDRWRGSLTRAFDFWKLDLDESYAKSESGRNAATYHHHGHHPGQGRLLPGVDDENVFESRTVLHHLAHMAMHVDIVDCQIFAGAARLLGRGITPGDYNGAQRRMKEGWAPTARARDATFYALRFLSQVLLSDHHPPFGTSQSSNSPAGSSHSNPHQPHQSPMSQHGRSPSQHHAQHHGSHIKAFSYSARDDYLLNRPWVLYFACLIVWSYGFALDGPIRPLYKLESHNEVVEDMQGYLRRVGGVRTPDDLQKIPNRNACLGLLLLMRDTFKQTRWELLHEASRLLGKCIDMLSDARP